MKAQFSHHYFKGGIAIFVYHVLGTPVELERFKAVQEANGFYREDANEGPNKGKPLFFTPRSLGTSSPLTITPGSASNPNGRVVPNDPQKAMAESEEFQRDVRRARAQMIAQRQMAGSGVSSNALANTEAQNDWSAAPALPVQGQGNVALTPDQLKAQAEAAAGNQ